LSTATTISAETAAVYFEALCTTTLRRLFPTTQSPRGRRPPGPTTSRLCDRRGAGGLVPLRRGTPHQRHGAARSGRTDARWHGRVGKLAPCDPSGRQGGPDGRRRPKFPQTTGIVARLGPWPERDPRLHCADGPFPGAVRPLCRRPTSPVKRRGADDQCAHGPTVRVIHATSISDRTLTLASRQSPGKSWRSFSTCAAS
jgi:hypothetical protein